MYVHTIRNLQECIVLREPICFKDLLYNTSFGFPVLSQNMFVPAYVCPELETFKMYTILPIISGTTKHTTVAKNTLLAPTG